MHGGLPSAVQSAFHVLYSHCLHVAALFLLLPGINDALFHFLESFVVNHEHSNVAKRLSWTEQGDTDGQQGNECPPAPGNAEGGIGSEGGAAQSV